MDKPVSSREEDHRNRESYSQANTSPWIGCRFIFRSDPLQKPDRLMKKEKRYDKHGDGRQEQPGLIQWPYRFVDTGGGGDTTARLNGSVEE